MSIVISTTLSVNSNQFDEIEQTTKEVLANHGFGILTEIDAKETLKKKLGVEMKPYKILGACNPPNAHKAISLFPEIGALLPCNVIIYVNEEDDIVVSAMNPKEAMSVIQNDELTEVATNVSEIMSKVIQEIEERYK
jgi:uncharacterized protein (DUF302 family)